MLHNLKVVAQYFQNSTLNVFRKVAKQIFNLFNSKYMLEFFYNSAKSLSKYNIPRLIIIHDK